MHWQLLLSLAAGLVAGVTAALFKVDGGQSIVIGATVSIVVETAFLHHKIRHVPKLQEALFLAVEHFKRGGVLEDYFIVLLSDLGRTVRSLKKQMLRIPDDEFQPTWLGLLRHFEHNLTATSYVKPEDAWLLVYAADEAQGIQEQQVRQQHRTIKRLFICGDLDEALRLTDIMTAQVNVGIDVRWILEDTISSTAVLNQARVACEKALGTIDFGSFDGKLIVLVHLNKQRRLKGASLAFDQDKLKSAQAFFDVVWLEGKPPPPKAPPADSADSQPIADGQSTKEAPESAPEDGSSSNEGQPQ